MGVFLLGLKELALLVPAQSVVISALELIRNPTDAFFSICIIVVPLLTLNGVFSLIDMAGIESGVGRLLRGLGVRNRLVRDSFRAIVLIYSAYWAGSQSGWQQFQLAATETSSNPLPNVVDTVLGLAIGLAVEMGVASAQTPCIDARPSGLIDATLTFLAGDGRSVTRMSMVLRNFDPASNILTIDDGGQIQHLNLNEWSRNHIGLQGPPPMVQAPMPIGTAILNSLGQKYKLSTMKIVDGLVSFGDCQNPSGPGEIRFGGELAFDAQSDALVVNGTFWRYEMPSGGSTINPGIRKGGIP